MEPLMLNPTEDTPKVILDAQNMVFEISGRSLPEDVTVFYKPVLDWLSNYPKGGNKIDMNMKLEYFNTASSKLLLDILMKLEEMKEEGICEVSVKWHYDESDEDMQEAGEEYSELVGLSFELVPY